MDSLIYQSADTEYVVTDNIFIMRTTSLVEPAEIFSNAGIAVNLVGDLNIEGISIKLIDFFPEANVHVFHLAGRGHEDFIQSIKDKVNANKHPELKYIGSVLKHKETGIYQIYTGNIIFTIYASFDVELYKNQILEDFKLELKQNIDFSSATFFCEFKETIGKDIFEKCKQIKALAYVQNCYPELIVKRRSPPSVNLEMEEKLNPNWVSEMIDLDPAWDTTKGKGVIICIIDDGIDNEHPAFNREGKIVASRDMLAKGKMASHKFPSEYHGTAVAGVAASEDDEVKGIAPDASLMIIRCKGLGSVHEAEAIAWAADQGADIICCSWGPPDGNINDPQDDGSIFPLPELTRKAIDYATTKGRDGKGCLIFFAAGNGKENVKNDGYASYDNVMAIGSVNKDKVLTTYSDSGYPLFACFPSSEIILQADTGYFLTSYGIATADRIGAEGYVEGNIYYHFGGTSASAPGMAGAAALMLSVDNSLTLNDAKQILRKSCLLTDGTQAIVPDDDYGWGIINANLLVKNTLNQKINVMQNTDKNSKRYAIHVGVDFVDTEIYGGMFKPLSGCVNDTNKYKKLTIQFDKIKILLNDDATRSNFREAFEKVIEIAKAGDVVVITYAGHGSYIEDFDGDEEDGDLQDETLVLYDGFWIDDETKNLIAKFEEDVNLIWISDSCHSGTNTRGFMEDAIPSEINTKLRYANPALIRAVYDQNRNYYNAEFNRLEFRGQNLKDLPIKANVCSFAACQDEEFAQEIMNGGIFTNGIFDAISNRSKQDGIADIFNKAVEFVSSKRSRQYLQMPNAEFYGGKAESIKMLDLNIIFNLSLDETKSSKSKIDNEKNNKPTRSNQKAYATSILNVKSSSSKILGVKTRGSLPTFEIIIDGKISRVNSSVSNAWDNAYDTYFNASNKEDIEFIEPELLSTINADPSEIAMRGNTPLDADKYLPTYPHPLYEDQTRFAWHLRERYSQLDKAFKFVCPEYSRFSPIDPDNNYNILAKMEYPLIGIIDTGNSNDTDLWPLNYESKLSRNFTSFNSVGSSNVEDTNNKLLPASFEQQGHGQATMMLLAGKEFKTDLKHEIGGTTYKDNMPKFIGGFPFARVMMLRTSDSVVILCGSGFEKSVNHCIENGASVISMSMAGLPSRKIEEVVNKAYEAGIVIVSAAGNSWSKKVKKNLPKSLMYPARFERVIAATGITGNYEPYLDEYHDDTDDKNTMEFRAAGGEWMQSCYGPKKLMQYSLAAYTPNIPWVYGIGPKKYTRCGGGTSSATPQIASAAALYIHHYKDWFNKNIKSDAKWKKAEIVRQALFRSGSKHNMPPSFIENYFPNGCLRAYEALEIHPQTIMDEIISGKVKKAPKADLGFFIIDDIIKLFTTAKRGNQSAKEKENLKTLMEMISLEIQQLIMMDEDLEQFASSENLTEEFIDRIVSNPNASSFLRKELSLHISRRGSEGQRGVGSEIMLLEKAETKIGSFSIWSNTNPVKSKSVKLLAADKESQVECKFEFEFDQTSLRSGAVKLGYSYESDEEHALLAYSEMEDGKINAAWIFPDEITNQSSTRSAMGQKMFLSSNEQFMWIDEQDGFSNRGLGDWLARQAGKIQKVVIKVVNTVLDRAVSGEERLLYSKCPLKVGEAFEWISEIPSSGIKGKNGTLLLLHGTWSETDITFKDLLANSDFRSMVKSKYGQHILAYEMSTIRSGIGENAEKLLKFLKAKGIEVKDLTIIAASRGCLVAREAFKKEELKMVLAAGAHLGTPLADRSRIKKLLNQVTNLSLLYTGPSAPILSGILKLVVLISNGVYNSPGIQDQATDSKFLDQLNKSASLTDKQLFIGSNYEPTDYKYVVDESIDRLIFKSYDNDGVVPVFSSMFEGVGGNDNASRFFVPDNEINHFEYFKNVEVVKRICEFLK